ncbi:hypothetical protein TNCT_146791 [Trichonephila clavata]|uniref:Uncharacterized protein n=1 Tax=Trichonephila clavata TaxID=2740835 RepID=A0A8X6FM71_TRICU|nr:hypothetical protein TNCT_146791 [Trichonephila clavata]
MSKYFHFSVAPVINKHKRSKRDCQMHQKRLSMDQKRLSCTKRDCQMHQKRLSNAPKETAKCIKRDYRMHPKRFPNAPK